MSFDIPDDSEVLDIPAEQAVRKRRAGVHDVIDINDSLDALYHRGGIPRGDSTGWVSVDQLYTVAGGQWTLVTGIPGMGKSEWLDALAVNLAEQHDWHFAIYSPENHPIALHAAKIVEKRVRRPFNIGPRERVTAVQLAEAQHWMHDRFTWINPTGTAPVDVVIHALAYGSRNKGRKFGIIVDPWNALDHHDGAWRAHNMSETEYVSHTLSQFTKILRADVNHNVHLWIVAHPAKLYRQQDGTVPMPSGYDVAGSAHWFNKADNIIVVHRDKADNDAGVDIVAQKIRFKNVGHVGVATLSYDRVTGRYDDRS